MTPWLTFGAGESGIDAKTLELALMEHRPVIAVVRNPQVVAGLQEEGVQIFIGNAHGNQVTACTCHAAGQYVTMISSMGGAQDYLAHRTVTDEAERAEIRRTILVTSLGRGDSWPFLSPCTRTTFGQAVREKSLAESWLQANLPGCAILRPDDLLNGKATGLAQRIQAEEYHGFVMRADVARRVHELTTAPALGSQIYSLVEPGLKPT